MTICGFSTKSQPEILLVSSNKPALTLPTMWMVSLIYFSPFGLTPFSWALKDDEDGTDPQKMSAMTVIGDRTNPSQSGEPNITHRSNIGSQGVQPHLIHRSNTGSIRGSAPTSSTESRRQREIGPQRFGRCAPGLGRQGVKCRTKTGYRNVFYVKCLFSPFITSVVY